LILKLGIILDSKIIIIRKLGIKVEQTRLLRAKVTNSGQEFLAQEPKATTMIVIIAG
jgi:hypothetical protein